MSFQLEQSVKLNSQKVKEDIDRGVGKIVDFTPDGYVSVDFRVPEYENLWLLPEEIEPATLAVRKNRQDFNFNVIDCGGRCYEVPSNEPDGDKECESVGYGSDDISFEDIIWQEF